MFIRYAGALGEFNPVHEDPEAAVKAGYPGVFAQGMLIGGALAQYLVDWFGPGALLKYTARFVGPVFVGDRIDLGADIVEATSDGGRHVLKVRGWAKNQAGVVVTACKATVTEPV
jgi:acyl dehydratase